MNIVAIFVTLALAAMSFIALANIPAVGAVIRFFVKPKEEEVSDEQQA